MLPFFLLRNGFLRSLRRTPVPIGTSAVLTWEAHWDAALWEQLVERGWVVKPQGTRATIVTDEGKQQFQKHFGIQVNERP
jgi:hypothetical protein